MLSVVSWSFFSHSTPMTNPNRQTQKHFINKQSILVHNPQHGPSAAAVHHPAVHRGGQPPERPHHRRRAAEPDPRPGPFGTPGALNPPGGGLRRLAGGGRRWPERGGGGSVLSLNLRPARFRWLRPIPSGGGGC